MANKKYRNEFAALFPDNIRSAFCTRSLRFEVVLHKMTVLPYQARFKWWHRSTADSCRCVCRTLPFM